MISLSGACHWSEPSPRLQLQHRLAARGPTGATCMRMIAQFVRVSVEESSEGRAERTISQASHLQVHVHCIGASIALVAQFGKLCSDDVTE